MSYLIVELDKIKAMKVGQSVGFYRPVATRLGNCRQIPWNSYLQPIYLFS